MGSEELQHLDLLADDFDPSSDEVLSLLLSDGVARTDVGLAVLRYEWVRVMLGDRRLRHATSDFLSLQGVDDGPLAEWWRLIMLTNEGERHKRLRSLVARSFTPSVAEKLRGTSRETFSRLVDQVEGEEVVDAASRLADQYPIAVISSLLGVPDDRLPELSLASNDLAYVFSFEVSARRESLEKAVVSLLDLAGELIDDRRVHPGDDLISAFIAAETANERFTEDELHALVVSMIFAGHDTTRRQLLRALELFASNPDQWDLLAANPGLISNAVEEVLRLAPSTPVLMRIPTEDMDVYGQHVAEGDMLLLCVAIAHHDPEAFVAGKTFDIRPERQPHLAFGSGAHYCVGASLAKVELQEALLELTHRFRPPVVAGHVAQRGSFGLIGPTSLPLQFTARPAR
jgi:cytochrome P450